MAEYAILAADQGTDTTFEIDVVDGNKNPRNLTGFTVAAKYRKQFNSNVVYAFEAAIADPPTSGKIRMTLSGAFTNTIDAGRYFYDVEIRNSALNVVERVVEGFIEFSPSATRSATDFIATTRLIPVKLDDLVDVDITGQGTDDVLVYKADSDKYVFKSLNEISGIDSESALNLIDSDYIRSAFSAGSGIAISDSGEISVTTDFIVDSADIIRILETADVTLNGGTF